MAYDETLAQRVRQSLAHRKGVTERRLFGCFCFLVHGKVCAGVWKQALLVRLTEDDCQDAFKEHFVRPFNITGRPLKGWAVIELPGCHTEEQLDRWMQRAQACVAKLPAARQKKRRKLPR